jgi:ABC-type sugar transport system ATPase subunit
MMVGRQITNLYGARSTNDREEYFRVEGFSRRGRFHDIHFSLRRGEILGLAGLVGAGRTDVGRAIFGIDRKDSGRLFLNGAELHIRRPQDAIHHKIAYLTEDRKGQGLFLGMPLRENLVAPSLERFTNALGFVNLSQIDRYANEMVREYAIATPSIEKKVLDLSGGNQQKALVAMWVGIQPEVLIFDEPTRGVDVGARAEIYARLRDFAAAGVGVIMISSDLPELIGMCDRILVMHQGRITGEVSRKDFSEAHILSYAAGLEEGARSLDRRLDQPPA